MDRKPLGQSQIPSKIPGVGLKSKIPGPTPNKGILKKGVKRDSDQISDQKENVQITAPKPLAKKPSYMRPTQSRSAARKSLGRARRSLARGVANSPGKIRRVPGGTVGRSRLGSTTRPGVSRPAASTRPTTSRTAAATRTTTTRGTTRAAATKTPEPQPEKTEPKEPEEPGSRVRLTAEGKIIVKGVKKFDQKERMKVLEIVLAEKILEVRNNKASLAALTTAFESIKTEKAVAVEETKELSEYKKIKEQECANVEEKYSNAMRDIRRLKNDLDSTQEHLDNTTKRLKTERLEKEELQADYDSAHKKIQNLNNKIEDLNGRNRDLTNEVEDQNIKLAEMTKKLEDGDEERRNLHEAIQQLKGNIRVFARIRPLLPREIEENHVDSHITYENNPDKALEILPEGKKEPSEFEFDKVFRPGSTQGQVFEEVQQLVRSSLDGYNVCIFAYGQTGSGKTFSMEGPEDVYENEDMVGIIPRSFDFLMETVEKSKEKGWTYSLEAAYLEVYCEELRDLLCVTGENDKKLKVEGAGKKHVNVAGLTRHAVQSKQQILNLMKRANKRRATASTNVNLRSSRSHSVFIMFIKGHNERTDMKVESCLNLVDLAGSERVKESGATGQRFEEAKKINGSLSSLGDVIAALGAKSKHIPYRNSKLTHLLQNSIGGNSKTLMIMHLNPRAAFANESLNTLRFAHKVNNTNIGTAQKVVK